MGEISFLDYRLDYTVDHMDAGRLSNKIGLWVLEISGPSAPTYNSKDILMANTPPVTFYGRTARAVTEETCIYIAKHVPLPASKDGP